MNKIKSNKEENSFGLFNSLKKVVSGTAVSRIFGLIRDISTTNLLGASVFHDIFVICLKIPNLFRRFFAEGAFNQAFIPIYTDYENSKDNDFIIFKENSQWLQNLIFFHPELVSAR